MRRSAKASIVGNTEAIESPIVQAAIHNTLPDEGQVKMAAALKKQPQKSVSKIVRGRNRAAIGIAIKRPKVNTNKNTAFNLYAALLSPRPVCIV